MHTESTPDYPVETGDNGATDLTVKYQCLSIGGRSEWRNRKYSMSSFTGHISPIALRSSTR